MDTQQSTQWSLVLLLVGGILILVGGFAMTLMMGGFGFWMPMSSMMAPFGYTPTRGSWTWWMLGISLVSGALVLVAASRLRISDASRRQAGILGIIGGALGLLAMGGWLIGAVAAIVGGALALTTPPAAPK